ncbi:Putative Heat shock factor binding 1 [Septoria linicola]|uniref:Heat shock factor binding 1 n=1 Tax=Septoria linicola TaxID=215465 RepID=A0A9Q9AV73_9PEZI|nr:putative Heat shock factor binding 1 [Septoria linicola]USW52476.1 Putative Heat shock factor binding 1 [Septoria linicola]
MSDSASLSAQVNKLNVNTADSTSETKPSELVAVVDDLLNSLSSKFNNVSTEMLGKLDDMSKRLDALEAQIRAGNNNNNSASSESGAGDEK